MPKPHLEQNMPNGSVLCQHHLPLGMSKKVVLETVNKNLQDKAEGSISMCTLYKIWHGWFCNVKTPTKQQMSKCKICDEMKNAIEHCKCEDLWGKYVKWQAIHLQHMQNARLIYALRREEAITNMNKSMCITIDGMGK